MDLVEFGLWVMLLLFLIELSVIILHVCLAIEG